MTISSSLPKTLPQKGRKLPPLENGDRLTRREFERRYEAMPEVKKAELIEGVVYMGSPLRFESHAEPHGMIMAWLGLYYSLTFGVRLGDNPTVRLDDDNEVQPDAILFLEERLGGRSRISDDDYIEGTPELIAEIAASTASIDLGDKKKVYRRHGVPEYIVWQVYENQLEWFVLQEEEYVPLQPDAAGIIRSKTFPGLWLAATALLDDDMPLVISVLQQGLQATEYGDFVKSLTR